MFVDDHIAGNGQSLSGSLADFLGCEEGVKDLVEDIPWNAAACILDTDFCLVPVLSGGNGDVSLESIGVIAELGGYGMGGVDQQVEEDLAHFIGEAGNQGQVIGKICFHISQLVPFIAGDDQGGIDQIVQGKRNFFLAAGMRELLHGPDNG